MFSAFTKYCVIDVIVIAPLYNQILKKTKQNPPVYDVGCCVSVPMIQKARKWANIAAQYHARIASRKKDAKFYIAKGSLDADNTNGNSQDGLLQRSPTFSQLWTREHHGMLSRVWHALRG